MLGLDVTCRAIAAISLRRAFPNSAHYERFWHASASVATLSGWLAQQRRVPGIARRRRLHLWAVQGLRASSSCCADIPPIRASWPVPTWTGTCPSRRWSRLPCPPTIPLSAACSPRTGGCRARSAPPSATTIACRRWVEPVSPLKMPGRYHGVAIAQTAEYLLQQLTGAAAREEWAKLGPACCDLLGLDDAGLARFAAGA